jgi:hypothetical protein
MGVFNTLKKEGLAFGLPVTLMIGKDGCMLGAMNGPAEWAGEDAKALTGALKGTGNCFGRGRSIRPRPCGSSREGKS